jgi:hypothetical protein
VALDGRILVRESPESQDQSDTKSNTEALALVCSARLVLYNIYGCREPDVRSAPNRLQLETEMQRLSVSGCISDDEVSGKEGKSQETWIQARLDNL